ncbi:GPI transamidase component PIG-S-like isoform X2 [Patiria miniata]|uniref:GPI transamidase component PIG-S n=1 Tax=Patiria miniata TaxID=46514 RepID=A0A914A5U2_PATMI|nr:GPI transamidase component PIG-S-like isoform X2 [Patiria miniata]
MAEKESDKKAVNDDMSSDEVRSPMYAALAVAFIAVVIGLPVWWLSTTTYRANLPYQEIQELATAQTNCLIPVAIVSCLSEEERTNLDNFQAELNALLQSDERSILSIQYTIDWQTCSLQDQKILETSTSLAELDQSLSASKDIPHGQFTIYLVSQGYKLLQSADSFVGTGRVAVATVKDSIVASLIRTRLVNEGAMTRAYLNAAGVRLDKADADSMRSLLSTPGYELSFSLLNPQPDTYNAQWNIQEAVQAYLNPFLHKLSEFAEFTVNSQVLYFTGLSIKPKHNEPDDSYHVSQNALPLVINPVEAKLGSHVSTNPSLNFLLYIPRSRHLPLYITDNTGEPVVTNAFLSPRWGGVMIQNVPKPSENDTLPLTVEIDTRRAMEVFLAQLRLLIGIPQQVAQDKNIILASPDQTGITDWEYDVLLRSRTIENLATASSTLVSLAQLLNQIGNIVIRDDIADQVYQAVSAIKQGHAYLQGGNLYRAFHDSKRAIAASEKAFFDPSLLELLYFPDDQKFAIYIPLFLPIGIPVLSSFYKALKWMKTKTKTKQD